MIKSWFKFIGLSFFSDKIAKEAPQRGLGNIFLSAVLCLVFLVLGLVGSYTLTFASNYANTPELYRTAQNAFAACELEVKDGKLTSSVVIDTATSKSDKDAYSVGGYDIVIDTRPVTAYDDFTATCVSTNGTEVSYEEYLTFDVDKKSLFTFKVTYSGRERVIDAAWKARCEDYLDGQTDDRVIVEYNDIKKLTDDKYPAALYELYVKTYYPSMKAYETDGRAPRLRNYYFHSYGNNTDILFVFCDSMVGSYVTKTGAKNLLYGYYSSLKDGKVDTSAAGVDSFIKECYSGATSVIAYRAIMSFFSVVPFVVLVVAAVSVLFFCFRQLLKLGDMKFGSAAKIICSFVIVSSLISALFSFGLSFAVSQSMIGWIESIALFGVLAVRMTIMLIRDKVALKNAGPEGEPAPPPAPAIDPFEETAEHVEAQAAQSPDEKTDDDPNTQRTDEEAQE